MPRFFSSDISEGAARIAGDDARHIARVLRMRSGERLTVCDLAGSDYDCVLREISDAQVLCEVLEKRPCLAEPGVQVRLYQALPKADKLEWIVQKAVELGVYEIVPVETERCVAKWTRGGENKRERLQKIAYEAAKQAGRGLIPQILPVCGFSDAILGMKAFSRAILLYERATAPLRLALDGDFSSTAIFCGSEGGFSAAEADYAAEQQIFLASLGRRILRCETAPLCAVSAVLYAHGEF